MAEQHKKTSLLFGSERRDIVKREVRVHWGARRKGGRAALGDPFEQEGATVQPGKEGGRDVRRGLTSQLPAPSPPPCVLYGRPSAW